MEQGVGQRDVGFLKMGEMKRFGVCWEFVIPGSWSVGSRERGLGAGIPDGSERDWQDLGLGFGACWVLRLGPIAKDSGSWRHGS